jgi:hypothetical protein
MRRSFTALVTAGIAALSLVTGTAAAAAAPQSTATPQRSFTVLFDQFATRGPSGPNDQYIQLQNISQGPQDLSRFTVEAAPSVSQRFTVATIPLGTVLQSGDVYVIANVGFTGAVLNQYFSSISLPDRVGICLKDPSGGVIDAVATVAASPCGRGAPATAMTWDRTHDQPLANVRRTNTDNNAVDFHIMPRTPGVRSHVSLF